MSNVNLNLYRIFCKVAESKSYSEAAEKLNLSVSNVSTQISNLESQLDLKLFNRETKGVTLTEEGQELYEIVNKSISSFDFAEKLAKDKNNIDKDIIKIGFYEVRIKSNLSENEAFEFVLVARKILESLNYNVYLTKAKYEYKGKKYTVQDNELMVAIKI